MTLDFKLPDVGEGVAEGEIVNWLVAVGDEVQEHQAVVEVSTDKAVVEIPSPARGRIKAILVPAGQVVATGTVIFQMDLGAPTAARSAINGPVAPATSIRSESVRPATVPAVPTARRVARELGIDLAQVAGSGRDGIVRRTDVEAHAAAVATGARTRRVPFTGVRRRIAAQVQRSRATAVHFTVVEEVDFTELVRLMPRAKEIASLRGTKLTYTPFVMKALTSALTEHSMLNVTLDEAAGEIVVFDYVNLGVAVDAPAGLLVPVVRDAQDKGVLDLARELNRLAKAARIGNLRPEDMRGGTFTLSNAGQVGSILATPIINFPEGGILGMHRIVKRPGVVEAAEGDRVEVRQYMNLSLSVDHRLIDGMLAVRALVHLKRLLETPERLPL